MFNFSEILEVLDIGVGVFKEGNFGICYFLEGLLIIFWNGIVLELEVLFMLMFCVKLDV